MLCCCFTAGSTNNGDIASVPMRTTTSSLNAKLRTVAFNKRNNSQIREDKSINHDFVIVFFTMSDNSSMSMVLVVVVVVVEEEEDATK